MKTSCLKMAEILHKQISESSGYTRELNVFVKIKPKSTKTSVGFFSSPEPKAHKVSL